MHKEKIKTYYLANLKFTLSIIDIYTCLLLYYTLELHLIIIVGDLSVYNA